MSSAKWSVLREQAGRFLRLAVTAFVASGIVPQIVSGTTSRTLVVAAAVGAVEVAWRSMFPVVTKAAVDSTVHQGIIAHLTSLVEAALKGGAAAIAVPDPGVDAEQEGAGFAGSSAVPAEPVVPPVAPAVAPVDVTSVVSEPVPASPPVASPPPVVSPPAPQ
jgi:hypothetical protein